MRRGSIAWPTAVGGCSTHWNGMGYIAGSCSRTSPGSLCGLCGHALGFCAALASADLEFGRARGSTWAFAGSDIPDAARRVSR